MMKDEEEKDEEEIVLHKAVQVAFCSLRECRCVPFRQPNGRVAFKAHGNVYGALAELASNPKVPILDFLNRLDAVRSSIFALKEDRR